MKEFFKYILCVPLFCSIVYSALLYIKISSYQASAPLRSTEGCTAAIFGNSIGGVSWDPEILTNIDNRCVNGTSIYWTRAGIIDYLETNKQINIAYINWDLVSYYMSGGNKGSNSAKTSFLKQVFPWVSLDLSVLYPLQPSVWVRCLIGTNVVAEKKHSWHCGFSPRVRNNIYTGQWSRSWYQKKYPKPMTLPLIQAEQSHSLILKSIRGIIAYCHDRKIKVVLVSMPMYHIETWFDSAGYYEFLATLDERVEVADYSHFEMPDDTYFADVHHLNAKGSSYFCRYLRENGIQSLPVKEYLRQIKGTAKVAKPCPIPGHSREQR